MQELFFVEGAPISFRTGASDNHLLVPHLLIDVIIPGEINKVDCIESLMIAYK